MPPIPRISTEETRRWFLRRLSELLPLRSKSKRHMRLAVLLWLLLTFASLYCCVFLQRLGWHRVDSWNKRLCRHIFWSGHRHSEMKWWDWFNHSVKLKAKYGPRSRPLQPATTRKLYECLQTIVSAALNGYLDHKLNPPQWMSTTRAFQRVWLSNTQNSQNLKITDNWFWKKFWSKLLS